VNNDKNIGIDPTTVNILETLDMESDAENKEKRVLKAPKTPNPDKKKESVIGKIFFVIIILALMAGVAYGVFYYLNLGRKESFKAKYSIVDKTIYVGDKVSKDIFDYGNFAQVDISSCALDVSKVDSSKAGEYNYNVICDGSKYTAKIIVKDRTNFLVTTNVLYKQVGDTIDINDFIKGKDNYTYEFENKDETINLLGSAGGPHIVNIVVDNNQDEKIMVSSVLYVLASSPKFFLTCESNYVDTDNYSYRVIDKFAIGNAKNNMDKNLRIYEYVFSSQNDYLKALSTVSEGMITIDGKTGIALQDYEMLTIKVVQNLSKDILNEEYGRTFPTQYNQIQNYYKETKKYSCSI